MTNKPNFIGWSGKTEFTISDLINSNFSGNSQSLSNVSSRIIEGPITISNTPKDGPARTGSTEPIYQTGVTQTFSAFNLQSVNTVLGSNLPFTAGTVDYSFPAGSGFTEDGFNGAVYHIAVDANGKYVIGGGFTTYYYNGNSYTSNRLIRLNTDGTVDESFDIGFNNDCYGGGFNDTVYTLEIQPDGKILVGGAFTRFDRDGNCNDAYRIIRLNSDGSRDLSFNTGNGFDSDVYDIHIQPDGKILVGGDFRVYNDYTEAYRIIRLNTNGSIDSSFLIGGSGVSFDNYVNVIELQPNGKILVGGYFTQYGGVSQNYITRLNTDGTLDTTFQIGNGFNEEVYSLVLQSDGKIIVGGYFNYFDNNDLFYGNIIRLNSNGTLDTLFGHGLDSEVHSLAIQSDGKILVGGYFNTYVINNASVVNVNKLIRFNSDGSFDYSFYSEQNSIYNDGVEYISILENDNILVGGFFNNYDGPDPLVYPLNYFGRIHNSISVYPYTYTVQACSQPLMNETITYVVGSMTPLSSNKTYSFQSLQNPSITVCGFITETYPSNVIEYSMVNEYNNCYDAYISNYKLVTLEDCIAPGINQSLPVWIVDNKYEINDILYVDIVFDGEGRTFNKFAAKITSVDPNWNVPFPLWEFLPPINYAPYSSCEDAIEANGLIYVAESCTEMEAVFPLIHKPLYDSISLLIPTGNNPVKVISDYLPYGSYSLISGGTPEIFSTVDFGSYNDSYDTLCDLGLRKISPSGIESDNFLNTGFDGNLVYTMVEQPDGKILVGGNFSDYLEVSVGNFMRINPDGSLDETFYLGQFNSYIRAITIQPDGKILVGGNFTNYDGYNAGRIIRLNSDGTIDSNFTYLSEFDDTVRAIAIQRDGKIVVGGDFSNYYDFYCPQIVRLNSNGTPDPTFIMGDGFDGDSVYTINIESIRNQPFFIPSGPTTYTENIIVGGYFSWYNGTNVGGIVKLSSTGEVLPDFGGGFNRDTGGTPRVNQIVQQPDGKLIVIGGGNEGYELYDYNSTWIPENIVRLVKINDQYVIDETFTTIDWDSNGGFNGAVLTASVLPNGKIMIGGQFNNYEDNNNEHIDIPYLVRLNSNGTLDETFTFMLDDDYVNKTLLLSSGKLLVGGRFNTPSDLLLELYIGEDYELHSFNTCDGLTSNLFLPTDFPIATSSNGTEFNATPITYELISTDGLDLVYDGDNDDDNFVIVLPTPFDVNFLGVNYTSVNVSTNPYITFGDGGNPSECCFDIPDEIPSNVELPGVFLSFQCGAPESPGDYDADMLQLYTGLTDGGNTLIIKYFGKDHCNNDEVIPLNYTYRFYKDNSDYFDLLIDENTLFFNDDPTGGVSNGVDPTWVTTFDSTGGNAYRIGYSTNSNPIKANINERVAVCGTVGNVITTPQVNGGGIGGSMYFDGVNDTMVQVDNTSGQFGFGGVFDFTIEWFQYYEGGSSSRPFSIGVYDNPNEMIGMSFEGSVLLWVNNVAYNTTIVNDDLLNGWHHMAITRNFDGSNRTWRVFLDGILKYEEINNNDTTNTYTLTLGNQLNNDGLFRGYITNFRVNNQTALYTSNFTVPTSPLPCDSVNFILTMNATDESGLLYDTCTDQTITATGVTWSTETPFINLNDFTLFTATNNTSYTSCDECLSTTKLNAITYQRDGVSPNKVVYTTLTQDYINNILTNGPIWTYGPYRECYELLTYYK